MNKVRIAVVRVRGKVGVRNDIAKTLRMLRLYNVNTCIVIPNNPQYIGMLNKVKDYVTWGEISKETFKELLQKRGRLFGRKNLTEDYLKEKMNMTFDEFVEDFFSFKKELKDIPGLKLFFRLCPPRKGYGRKGIKKPFSLGGALGYRKDKINDLIKRMM